MMKVPATSRNRAPTLIFLAVSCLLGIGAIAVGVSDNPPGLLLAYLAGVTGVVAFVHPWRTAGQYVRLFCASVLGLVLLATLHNVLEAIAGESVSDNALYSLLHGLSIAAFLLAILVCPSATLVGAVGSVVTFIQDRCRPKQGNPAR